MLRKVMYIYVYYLYVCTLTPYVTYILFCITYICVFLFIWWAPCFYGAYGFHIWICTKASEQPQPCCSPRMAETGKCCGLLLWPQISESHWLPPQFDEQFRMELSWVGAPTMARCTSECCSRKSFRDAPSSAQCIGPIFAIEGSFQ